MKICKKSHYHIVHSLPMTQILLSFRHLWKEFSLGVLFIQNESILLSLTMSYQELFVFSVSAFFFFLFFVFFCFFFFESFQIFTVTIILRAKMDLSYAISIVNWIFGVFVFVSFLFLLEISFLHVFANLK